MNENGNKYALAALKDRRGSIAGEIIALERRLRYCRESLTHLDASIRLFDPSANPEAIPAKQRRVKLFRQGELGRTILDALRRAGKPIPTADIVTAVIVATGASESARPSLAPRVRGNLCYLENRKAIQKSGKQKGVLWALADAQLI